jgi:1-acyl-sn-glycerol-3-phosphate acyltransferase
VTDPGPRPLFFADAAEMARAIAQMFGSGEPEGTARLEERLVTLFRTAPEEQARDFFRQMAEAGEHWGYEPPHPLARRLSEIVLTDRLEPGSVLDNSAALERLGDRPVAFVGNHLSFVDANVLAHLLARSGHEQLAERLCVIVGPKVFSDPVRRVATLCFGTVKTPQSASRASGAARMSPREVARLAARSLAAAQERLDAGDALLIFVEGTRSRSGTLQRALAGVARYLKRPDLCVVPFGLAGSERLTPIASSESLYRTRVRARVDHPIVARQLLDCCKRRPTLMMDVIGFRIAGCLPDGYRGVYDGTHEELADAEKLARTLAVKDS